MTLVSHGFAGIGARFAAGTLCLALLATAACAAPSGDAPASSASAPASHSPVAADHWVGSWASAPLDFRQISPLGTPPPVAPDDRAFPGLTLRQQLQPSVGGERLRVRFSNRFGTAPLGVTAASVARGTGGGAISPSSLRALRFDGRPGIVIAPGAEAWSDGVDFAVEAGQTLVVSSYYERSTPLSTVHLQPSNATWMSNGNAVAAARLPEVQRVPVNAFVTGVDVWAPRAIRTVVAFGDSITAGGLDGEGGGNSYPQQLATLLRKGPGSAREVAVLNVGIGGNRLLYGGAGRSGLARFGDDVLGQSGVTHVIVLMGTNDIGRTAFIGLPGQAVPAGEIPTPEQLEAGLQQLVRQARERGLKVLLGTIPPFKGSSYWNEHTEALRGAVNRWIRGRQDVDAVADFDAALRDPAQPLALLPAYDSGDHLHPNAAGFTAMAGAVDLQELRE